jgi:hypothetical protein
MCIGQEKPYFLDQNDFDQRGNKKFMNNDTQKLCGGHIYL